ncbi:hypothetical protein KCU65_g420, partial [Aureobasidium melanogenum]
MLIPKRTFPTRDLILLSTQPARRKTPSRTARLFNHSAQTPRCSFELANGLETLGFVCEVIEEVSGETGNRPFFDFPPPTEDEFEEPVFCHWRFCSMGLRFHRREWFEVVWRLVCRCFHSLH